MSGVLLNRLANPTNEVAAAFEARTSQLEGQRKEEQATDLAAQDRRDNDMRQAFEYLGDGQIEAATSFARQKGLDIPKEVLENADFAKGLSFAGERHGNDKQAAERFSVAWNSNPSLPLPQRYLMASEAGGIPVDPDDRAFKRKMELEQFKIDNRAKTSGAFSLSPGQTRYGAGGQEIASIPAQPPISRFEAGQKAYNEVASSMRGNAETAEKARLEAYRYWDEAYAQPAPVVGAPAPVAPGGVSSGLVGNDPVAQSQNAIIQRQSEIGANPYQTPQNTQQQIPSGLPSQPEQPVYTREHGVYAVQQLLMKGYTQEQINKALLDQGKDQYDIDALFQGLGGQ